MGIFLVTLNQDGEKKREKIELVGLRLSYQASLSTSVPWEQDIGGQLDPPIEPLSTDSFRGENESI